MPEQNLNPDALEAMSRVMNPDAWGVIDRYPEDDLVIMTKEAELAKAEKLAAAYLSALPAQPKLDQRSQRMVLGKLIGKALHQCGISVTYAFSGPNELFDVAGILLSEYPALAPAQPVLQENSKPNQNLELQPDTVNSVEDAQALAIAVEAAKEELWGRLNGGYISDEEVERSAKAAVSAYISGSPVVINSKADLLTLPVGSVIKDSDGELAFKSGSAESPWKHEHGGNSKDWVMADFLPATVLYRPVEG